MWIVYSGGHHSLSGYSCGISTKFRSHLIICHQVVDNGLLTWILHEANSNLDLKLL